MGKTRAKRKSERTIFPYVLLREASEYALIRVRNKENIFIDCVTVILFSAFCLEAYLNNIGKNIMHWKSIEWEKPKTKLKVICDSYKYPLDLGKRPFQSFSEIMNYRNQLVHGKTATITSDWYEVIDIEKDIPEMELTKWEKLTTPVHAEKYFEDTGSMIKTLDVAAGFDRDPFITQYMVKFEQTPIDDK